MKAKAMRLGKDRPLEKVDSSTFVPPEMLNADVKTGLRPISRRAFKKGGKVMGDCNAPRADRKPRKAGGKTEATEYANAKINRNVKAANEEREGKKHIGALKTGGRAKHSTDGSVQTKGKPDPKIQQRMDPSQFDAEMDISKMPQPKDMYSPEDLKRLERGYKKGGRTKKAAGGAKAAAERMMQQAQETSGVSGARMNFQPVGQGKLSPMRGVGMKKGGTTKHDDVKQDMALIKKMVKSSARKGREDGGATPRRDYPLDIPSDEEMQKKAWADRKQQRREAGDKTKKPIFAKGGKAHPDEAMDKALIKKMVKSEARKGKDGGGGLGMMGGLIPMAMNAMSKDDEKSGKKAGGRAKRKDGGGVFSGAGYPHKIPGVVPGGREARATGGKTKGKTNINIVIAAGKEPQQPGMNPPGSPAMKPPGGIPVPVPPPGAGPGAGMGAPAGIPMPMPMPVPAAAGAAPPAGGLPLPRKSGGRISKIASSYKDMTAGSGGGEGRLQKTDIAKKHQDAPAFKKGGKVYRSYKDMDAGAGSGKGRLEKSEIAARKG
jgi:hypothetical protein